MKHLRKLLTLVVALVMTLGLVAPVFAEGEDAHTITITNSGEQGKHTYTAYQIFKGDLSGDETTLSNITWGDGVDPDKFLKALVDANAETGNALNGKFPTLTMGKEAVGETPAVPKSTAADVAKAIASLTANSKELDALAVIIGKNIGTAAGVSTETEQPYTISVTKGDGYYFIKDTGADVNGDTRTAYILNIVKNVSIEAKDTHITPDKSILKNGTTKVAKDSAAIGDTVTFSVEIEIPDTTKYKDHFVFKMNDKLPEGLTFKGVTSVKADGTDVPTANYAVTPEKPAAGTDLVTAAGGQTIVVQFKDFKKYVEDHTLIGKKLVITYEAVVNDDAKYGATGNENEVKFDYSNDPNNTYGGDDFDKDDPKGETPTDKTKTYVTTLEITKVDESGKKLADAKFELSGTALNKVLVTGEEFVKTAEVGSKEVIDEGPFYLLKDGSYTKQDPNAEGMNKTQYAEPLTDTYAKVKVNKVVTEQVQTKIVATSDQNGLIKFEGLNEGEYTLTELVAPDGFNKLAGPISINIKWEDPSTAESKPEADQSAEEKALIASGGFSVDTGSSEGVVMTADGAKFSITIKNEKGTTLPSTGGMGTTLFYVVGTMLVLGAGIVLVSKRRISE